MDYMTFLFIQPKTTMQHNDKQRERKIPCEISQLAINSASKKLLYKIFPALIELFLFYWKKYVPFLKSHIFGVELKEFILTLLCLILHF